MRKQVKKINGLFGLLLFAVFAVCILMVLLSGAEVYGKLTENGRASYSQRTAVQYLTTKLRQEDCMGSLRTESFDGCDALVLTEQIDGEIYETQIYYYDGYIRELFAEPDSGMEPMDGDPVLEAAGFAVSLTEGCLQAAITDCEGQNLQLTLSLRSGKEVPDEK